MKVLSVIIPMYNSEKTIKKCIDSIVHINNLEIILVDDGSTDNTKDICLQYQREYNNILYIHEENSGPGKARNEGIKRANGKYLMFIDADDYIETNNLKEIIIKYLLKENCDIIYYNFEQVSEIGNTYKSYNLEKFKGLNKEELIKNTISWKLPWGQFKIIKRKIVVENNIHFDENIKNSEELFFTINVLNKSSNIYFFNKIVYKYLKRQESISRFINIKNYRDTIDDVFERLYKEFENTEYRSAVYNYYIIANIHLLKQLAQGEKYKMFRNTSKDIRKNRKKMDCRYIAKRYKMILSILIFHLDFLLYFAFRIYFRRK